MRRILPAGLLAAAIVLLGVVSPASAVSYDDGDATFAELDATADVPGGPSTPEIAQRVFTVGGAGVVGRVEIGLTFTQSYERCDAVEGDNLTNGIYFSDIQYTLTSPLGTVVTLIEGDELGGFGDGASYAGSIPPPAEGGTPSIPDPVAVLLVDDASAPLVGSTNAGIPESGTFRPAQSVDAFDGELAAGDWILTIADVYPRSPHCYSASSFEVGVLPELAGAALPFGVVGRGYETTIPGIPAGSTLDVVDETEVPAGLAVDAQGVVTGIPEQTGAYAFTATLTDEEGTSAPATFTLDVFALPTLDGPATARATIGEAFAYAPTFFRGVPEADAVATGLPAGLEVDPATAAITGIPRGPVGEYVVDYVADNGIDPAATHRVTITIDADDVPPTTTPPTPPTTDPVPPASPPTPTVPAAAPTDPPSASSLPPTGALVGWGLVAAAAAAIGAGAALRRRRR